MRRTELQKLKTMSLPLIEFEKEMTLRERFREYNRYVLDGGYKLTDAAKRELVAFFDEFERGTMGAVFSGQPGTGKTIFFQMLDRVIHPKDPLKFRIRNAIDVVEAFAINGHESFLEYKKFNMLFDDLGAENTGMYFGDRIEVFEKLIQQRYNAWKELGVRTYFTTNLKPTEIEKRYGTRPLSRLREMCVHVVFNHDDLRGSRNFRGFPNVFHRATKDDAEWVESYRKRQAELSALPQPPRVGAGERLRKEIWGQYGPIAGSSTPIKKSRKKR